MSRSNKEHQPLPATMNCAPKRQSGEIGNLIDEMEDAISLANTNVSQLAERLAPVMHDVHPVVVAHKPETTTEKGLVLSNILFNINQISTIIDSIYSRLEI